MSMLLWQYQNRDRESSRIINWSSLTINLWVCFQSTYFDSQRCDKDLAKVDECAGCIGKYLLLDHSFPWVILTMKTNYAFVEQRYVILGPLPGCLILWIEEFDFFEFGCCPCLDLVLNFPVFRHSREAGWTLVEFDDPLYSIVCITTRSLGLTKDSCTSKEWLKLNFWRTKWAVSAYSYLKNSGSTWLYIQKSRDYDPPALRRWAVSFTGWWC